MDHALTSFPPYYQAARTHDMPFSMTFKFQTQD